MFKKIICLVMCVILLGMVGITPSADGAVLPEDVIIDIPENNGEIQPCYDYTKAISATLTNSSGKARCVSNVVGINGTTTKIIITMTLQKKTLLWWSKVETWTTTVNSYTAALSKTIAVDSGKHRVKLEATVYSGSKSEDITLYSATYDF